MYFTYGTRKKIMVKKLYDPNQHHSAGLVFTVLARLVYPVCGWLDVFYAKELGGLWWRMYTYVQ